MFYERQLNKDKLYLPRLLTPYIYACLSVGISGGGKRQGKHQLKSEVKGGYLIIVWEDTKRVVKVASSSLSLVKHKPPWEEGTWRKMGTLKLCFI